MPDEWMIARIDDLFDIQQGKQVSAQHRAGDRQRPFLRTRNVYWGRLDLTELDAMHFSADDEQRLQLRPGDLLTCEGGWVGRTAIWNGETSNCLYQNHLHRLRRISEATDPRFALYWLWYAFETGEVYFGRQNVTTIPNLSKSRLGELPMPYPNVAEQRQIARVLSAVQRAIERQERLIALTAELKKALMHKLFTEGARGEPLKQTEIGPVPQSWTLQPCDDLCEEISVGVVVRPRSYYVETGVPAFRSLNVREDRLETDELVYFSNEVNDGTLSKSKLRAGDVLIVRTGYPGTSCVVPLKYDGSNCIDLVIARPGRRITSNYLSRFFNSPSGKDQATAAKHGLAQQHLNVGAVKRVQVPLPTIEEQSVIVRALAAVDAKREVHVGTARKFGVLFRTLLHQLMTAQVRVHDLDLSALDQPAAEAVGVP
jgi:type I restriction enzyme S subunit